MTPFEFFIGVSLCAIAVCILLIFTEITMISKSMAILRDLYFDLTEKR